MTIRYTFVYLKDGEEISQTRDYSVEPTWDELNTQMGSYEPDTEVNFIREDIADDGD